jgi:hypothetical protein
MQGASDLQWRHLMYGTAWMCARIVLHTSLAPAGTSVSGSNLPERSHEERHTL